MSLKKTPPAPVPPPPRLPRPDPGPLVQTPYGRRRGDLVVVNGGPWDGYRTRLNFVPCSRYPLCGIDSDHDVHLLVEVVDADGRRLAEDWVFEPEVDPAER